MLDKAKKWLKYFKPTLIIMTILKLIAILLTYIVLISIGIVYETYQFLIRLTNLLNFNCNVIEVLFERMMYPKSFEKRMFRINLFALTSITSGMVSILFGNLTFFLLGFLFLGMGLMATLVWRDKLIEEMDNQG